MKPPDLPVSTPLKPRKEPSVYTITSDESNRYKSSSALSTATSNIKPFESNYNNYETSTNNGKRNYSEVSHLKKSNSKHEEKKEQKEKTEKIEKIEKKVKPNPEAEGKKMQIEVTPPPTDNYTGGLAALFGGGGGGDKNKDKDKDPKQSSGQKGLASLFGKSPQKEKESDDGNGSILNRLFNF